MKATAAAVSFLLITLISYAQETNEFPLWPDGAPGAKGTAEHDVPTLTPFKPSAEKANGTAIVICPGGGYGGLAAHEGAVYAQWLVDEGVTAFVLKYRLGSKGYRHPVMLNDVSRAIRLVRAKAQEWKISPDKIGIMGSSAGGHLASTLLTHFDSGKPDASDTIERQSSRPDFGILCYPVISMGSITHSGSKENLLGKEPSDELVALLSNEKQVTKDTPPTFVWHTWEDKAVKVENSMEFAQALRKAGVPFELHIYELGVHGIGLGKKEFNPGLSAELHPWTRDCLHWLKGRGLIR